jgi:hypothetical protein
MKRYCYAIVQSDGISHELWDTWDQYHSLDEYEDDDEEDVERDRDLWETRKTLPHLLIEGWRPVRETAMGGGRDFAYVLVLLERDA